MAQYKLWLGFMCISTAVFQLELKQPWAPPLYLTSTTGPVGSQSRLAAAEMGSHPSQACARDNQAFWEELITGGLLHP